MRVAESIILDALTRGGCIKTFYRISSRQAAESATRIPEGYILESPGEREDIVLSRADFHALEKLLEQKETWGHCCKVSDEAAFCLIQRPYISKTLLTRRISPRGSP
ncbi:hypothetical protein LVT69_26110 [Klebsiella pneumoniae]|nr:hypothetical protein [Klebsiella pneumoniae]